MLTNEQVQATIFRALEELNEERPNDAKLQIKPETSLFGKNSELDSLSLVSLIVDVEETISKSAGRQISLTDDRALEQPLSPFTTVRTLTDYILQLLSEA
jgi:acyl carrier protein